jgi:NADPH:quinone reductase-like Zn-dependent oxidoreductase
MYPAPAGAPPDILGLEYAGEVDELGDGVVEVAVGDRVMGIVGGGSYAEYLVTQSTHLVPVPDGYAYPDAAAIPETFITAHDALQRLEVREREWVLVNAIGSGVGTAALQLIHLRGAKCIGTSRTPAKLERALTLGLDAAVNSATDDLVVRVRDLTGGGANAVIDLVGGRLIVESLAALAPRGRLVLVGLTGGRRADVDLGVILTKRLRLEGTVLRSRSDEEKTDVVRSFRDDVLPALESRQVRPVVDRVFSFDQVQAAHQYVESNANFGKVVVSLDD